MFYNYHLSVAGVKICFAADRMLTVNEEFETFLVEAAEPDVYAQACGWEHMPQLPLSPIYQDNFCAVAKNEEGHLQKFFFDSADGNYMTASYDPDGRRVWIAYPAERREELQLQNCFRCLGFEYYLLRKNKLCLHAACVDTSLGGILFSGVSGIGKSTQAELWRKHRGAKPINGDRPILSKENGGWIAWGSPYAGSSNVHVNDSCDIAAIVLLKQAERCAIRKLSTAEAFRGIWAGLTVRTWDAAFVERASELTIELATGLPVYEFCCTPDEEAVRFLEEELRKENNK